MMKVLSTLQPKLDIDKTELPEYEAVINDIKEILHEHQIVFSENAELVFYAHMIHYVRRIKNSEELDMTYDEILKEIHEDVYAIAEEIVLKISERYGSPLDVSEILLIAIHIQTTLVKRME